MSLYREPRQEDDTPFARAFSNAILTIPGVQAPGDEDYFLYAVTSAVVQALSTIERPSSFFAALDKMMSAAKGVYNAWNVPRVHTLALNGDLHPLGNRLFSQNPFA